MIDVRLLHAEKTIREWTNRTEYQQQQTRDSSFNFGKTQRLPVKEVKPNVVKNTYDAFQSNLLSKISVSSSIIGSPSSPMNRSLVDDFKTAVTLNDSNFQSQEGLNVDIPIPAPKTIFNNAIDAFTMIENRKGFLKTNAINLADSTLSTVNHPIVGVYCIRWRRSGEKNENETKLIVNCVDIVEAPLNLYCYFDEKMYVKVPMTLTIILKNTTNATIHLRSYLKNADNFMFAGHTQVC